MSHIRRATEDPTIQAFHEWGNCRAATALEEMLTCDYAGCIFRAYRNSIVHELSLARGREAMYLGLDDPAAHPIFYENHGGAEASHDVVETTRFGIYPPYLLTLFSESVESVRSWALDNDKDVFSSDRE